MASRRGADRIEGDGLEVIAPGGVEHGDGPQRAADLLGLGLTEGRGRVEHLDQRLLHRLEPLGATLVRHRVGSACRVGEDPVGKGTARARVILLEGRRDERLWSGLARFSQLLANDDDEHRARVGRHQLDEVDEALSRLASGGDGGVVATAVHAVDQGRHERGDEGRRVDSNLAEDTQRVGQRLDCLVQVRRPAVERVLVHVADDGRELGRRRHAELISARACSKAAGHRPDERGLRRPVILFEGIRLLAPLGHVHPAGLDESGFAASHLLAIVSKGTQLRWQLFLDRRAARKARGRAGGRTRIGCRRWRSQVAVGGGRGLGSLGTAARAGVPGRGTDDVEDHLALGDCLVDHALQSRPGHRRRSRIGDVHRDGGGALLGTEGGEVAVCVAARRQPVGLALGRERQKLGRREVRSRVVLRHGRAGHLLRLRRPGGRRDRARHGGTRRRERADAESVGKGLLSARRQLHGGLDEAVHGQARRARRARLRRR